MCIYYIHMTINCCCMLSGTPTSRPQDDVVDVTNIGNIVDSFVVFIIVDNPPCPLPLNDRCLVLVLGSRVYNIG
jgi:hypothetical protein